MAKSKVIEKEDLTPRKNAELKKKEEERQEKLRKAAAAKEAARKGGDILDFLPVRSIENGLITFVNGKYGKVIKVGSLNISYLSHDEQYSKMRQLASVFNSVSTDCTILKLERKLDLTNSLDKQVGMFELLEEKYNNNEMTEAGYEQRKNQIQYEYDTINAYNTDYPVMIKTFYIILYHSSKETVLGATEDAFEKLAITKLEPKICNDAEIKTMYYYFYNPKGRRKESFFMHPEVDYKKEIMPNTLEFFASRIKTDTVHETVFSTYDYPGEVTGAWLTPLMSMPNTTCVMNIRNVEQSTAKALMDKAIREVNTQILERGKMSENMAKRAQLDSFMEVLRDIERGNEYLKLIGIYVMTYADNEKELRTTNRKVLNQFKQHRFKVDKLLMRQMTGLISMLPSPRDDIILANGRDIPSSTLGASFPFMFQDLKDKDGFLLGYNESSLIFFDPKTRSPSRTNSNMMIIGKSGSGKSHFTKKMLLKMILEGVKTFIVDPEGEYDIMTQRLGGQIIDVGSGNNSRINPFHIFGVMQEESGDKVLTKEEMKDGYRAIFSSHIQFLEQFMQNLIPDMTNREVSRLSRIFNEAYDKKKISKYEDFTQYKPEDFPIMDDVMAIVRKKIKELTDIIVKDSNRAVEVSSELNDLRNIEVYMDRLCGEGSLANLWNGATTIDTKNSDLILFDFRKMTNSKNDQVMNAQMMLVLRFLENEVSKNREHNLAKGDNRHVAIVVDEAHVFIDEKSPAALLFMHNMIKRIRKYNGIFVVITQNVNDFVGAVNIKKYTTAIINGCQYSFIFGLNPADLQSLIDLYASVGGFSEQEKDFIANAGIGQCLFVVAPGQRITMHKILVSEKEERAFKKSTDDQNFKKNKGE